MNTADVRGLTMSQPWASCMAYGTRRVHSHVRLTGHRGPVLIHAGSATDHSAWNLPMTRPFLLRPLPMSAVLAVARLDDCHADDGYCSLWSLRGYSHWCLTNVVALDKPVPWPGGSSALWIPPAPLLANPRVAEALEAARA
ncbi:hypothetical protein [Streptomyces sp. NPDC053048]|uniref:hypothetical protein n=1 Tax=Streptomyces sp. NPDC053048 TaxID=3365694 RepID=UPI0037D0C406